jgi:hypothetical protein
METVETGSRDLDEQWKDQETARPSDNDALGEGEAPAEPLSPARPEPRPAKWRPHYERPPTSGEQTTTVVARVPCFRGPRGHRLAPKTVRAAKACHPAARSSRGAFQFRAPGTGKRAIVRRQTVDRSPSPKRRNGTLCRAGPMPNGVNGEGATNQSGKPSGTKWTFMSSASTKAPKRMDVPLVHRRVNCILSGSWP